MPVALAAPMPAPSRIDRRLGAAVLLAAVAVMLPWLALQALVSGVVLGTGALARRPRALIQAIDYAGEVALGR